MGGRSFTASSSQAGDYSSSAPSAGSSAASTFESRFMLMAWISAIRCLKGVPSTSSSTSRYRRVPSTLTSCPFWRFLANFDEISPGIDAMPFGAGVVLAFVVLPALLGGDREDDVLVLVLGGFGFCVLSESADEDDFVEHGVWAPFLLVCPLSAVHACPTGVPSRPTPSATGENLRKGTQTCYGVGVRTSKRRVADSWKESVRPKGVGVLSAAR